MAARRSHPARTALERFTDSSLPAGAMCTHPGEGRWRFKVPVLVSDLDLECALWLKVQPAAVS